MPHAAPDAPLPENPDFHVFPCTETFTMDMATFGLSGLTTCAG